MRIDIAAIAAASIVSAQACCFYPCATTSPFVVNSVLIPARRHRRATSAVRNRFPSLVSVVTRASVIDAMLGATYESLPDRRRGQLLAIVAALAWSTAGILQRQLTLTAATQIVGRAVFALIALLAYVVITQRGQLTAAFRSVLTAPVVLVAVSLACASGTFVLALNHTTVAHVLIIQAMTPIFAALLGARVLHERVGAQTWATMLLAVVGVAVMVGASGQGSLTGDAMAFGPPIAFSVAIVVTRKHREISMAPATCLAQVLLIVFVGPLASGPVQSHDLIWLALLGVVQLGLGLICFTIGARLISAAEMAVISLIEVVLGPLWVWIGVHERPNVATVVGGAIVLIAVIAQLLGPDLAAGSQAERASERVAGSIAGSEATSRSSCS